MTENINKNIIAVLSSLKDIETDTLLKEIKKMY